MATSGVYSEDLIVRSLGGSSRAVTAHRFGPAGVLRLQLSDGVLLAVDAAQVGQLAYLDLDLDQADEAVLEELVGSEQARDIVTDESALGDRPRRLPKSPSTGSRRMANTSRPSPNELAQYVGEITRHLAWATAIDPRPVVKLVAAIEALDRSRSLDSIPALRNLFEERASAVITSLTDELPEIQDDIDLLSPTIGARVRQLIGASSLLSRVSGGGAQPDSKQSLEQRAESVGQDEKGWINLSFDRSKKNHWVRVRHAGTQELVAVAPILCVKQRYGADVWLPPDLRSTDLVVDVTLRPFPLPNNPVDLHVEAVRLGLRATLADRDDMRSDAVELWRQCAECWLSVGDTQRADLALRYSVKGTPRRRFKSLVDRIVTALDV